MLCTSLSWHISILLVSSLLLREVHSEGAGPNDPGLSRYVSRPDLAAPIWDVKIYHEDLVSPGYWFVAPYKALDQDQADRSWVGPHIYDGKTGELVWSGALSFTFSKGNVEDFRVSNVNGKYLMTLMSQNRGQGIVLDSNYEILHALQVDNPGRINTHEFNFVENGTRALVIKSHPEQATKEMSKVIGYDGECGGQFDGFEEYDTSTWESVFDFRSYGKVGFDESTMTGAPLEKRCSGKWDFIHSNSVDKTPEGDYLWSARHTDTIYKISGKDGSIIWRMGGVKSDFPVEDVWRFSRQHNIRYRGRNESHILVSMLDNAKGIDKQAPTWEFSRGLLLALDEKNMKVSIERQYDHPDGVGGYAPRRGNYQVLDNDNIFMGWSEQSRQSEHTPDGKLVMDSVFKTDWLGTYRAYKFPFVGHPIEPPVAVSQAYGTPNNSTVTTVHVSWNGATEIATWNLYRTVRNGQVVVMVATAEKFGFETVLAYGGFASYVIVEAVDKHGEILGRTSVVRTLAHENVTAEAVAAEDVWLAEFQSARDDLIYKAKGILGNPIAAFVVGIVCSVVVLLVGSKLRHRGLLGRYFRRHRYEPVSGGFDERDTHRRTSRKQGSSDDR